MTTLKTPGAGDLMTPSPAWCTPDDPVEKAARLMAEHDCGAIPVVDDPISRRPVGVVTDRDIVLRTVAVGRSPVECIIRDAMTAHPFEVHVDASFHDCARTMMAHRIRRLLVVDDRGKVIGMITDGDLARACRSDPSLEHDVAAMVEEVSGPGHFPPTSPFRTGSARVADPAANPSRDAAGAASPSTPDHPAPVRSTEAHEEKK